MDGDQNIFPLLTFQNCKKKKKEKKVQVLVQNLEFSGINKSHKVV